MDNQKSYNILIIEPNPQCNDKLKEQFLKFNAKVVQSTDFKKGLLYIKKLENKLDLIILSDDGNSVETISMLAEIATHSKAKVILISETEDIEKREKYFKYGILDYHMKSKDHVDYMVSDMIDAMDRLETNKKETILIIDDSKLVANVVKYLLANRNYNVIIASSAKEGISIINKHDISILILDMELPDMHGIKVLEVLREMYVINNFPILVLSGSDNPSIVRQALKKGSSDFLRKPFPFEEFLLKIDLWIKSSRWQKTIKSQKKQIENSLKGFEELVDSTIEALYIFRDNICVDLNFEAVKLLGEKNKGDILGKGIFDIFSNVSPEHHDEMLDDTVDHFFEDVMVNKENDILQVQIKERNILIDGKILKIIAVMDITDIKQQEKMLSHQTKMASMGEMIGNIAHQWRQPLTAISVAAGGIKLNYELDMIDHDEMLNELDNIVNNTQFLSSTIEDFQNFLKDDRSTTQFTIKSAVEKTLAIINANLESHEINVIQNYSENIQMNGIQNDLIQVLLNIVNNAADILKTFKDIEKKKLILIDASKKDEKTLLITIQDSAGGVPEKIIGKIFEPYFTTKHQAQGTGLGLYMTHQIVIDGMKGDLMVENCEFNYGDENHFGARFSIEIPLN